MKISESWYRLMIRTEREQKNCYESDTNSACNRTVENEVGYF